MKQISNKEYERYRQYQTDKQHGRILTPDGLRVVCDGLDNDPEKIGIHMLAMLAKFRNAEYIKEERLYSAVNNAINRLPEKRDELIRQDERIQSAEIENLVREMDVLEKRRIEVEEKLANVQDSEEDRINDLKDEMENLKVRYDALLSRRAELGIRKVQTKSLIELTDAMNGHLSLDMMCTGREAAACYDAEDFYRRTTKLLPVGPIKKYDDNLVRRFIKRVTIYESYIVVKFKAGVEIEVELNAGGATA